MRAAVSRSWRAVVVLVLAAAPVGYRHANAEEGVVENVAPATTEAWSADLSGVTVRVARDRGVITVEARCLVDASNATVWSVLTDYDGIDRFVSSMHESRVASRGDGYLMVEQVAVGRLFLFSRRLRATLRVHEEPTVRIRFEDVLRRDFTSYRGEWRIGEAAGRTEIVYHVEAHPSFSMPDFLARGVFKKTALELLSEVRAEVERRAALAVR